MKRLRWLTVLMGITLVIIIGFQVYWLNDNYAREKRTMEIKTGIAFQETVQQLQARKLKLPEFFRTRMPAGKTEKILFETNPGEKIASQQMPGGRFITTTNVVRKRMTNRKADSSSMPSFLITIQSDSNGIIKRTMPLQLQDYDSSLKNKEIFVEEGFHEKLRVNTTRRQIVTMVNTMRSKLSDSTKMDSLLRSSFFVRIPKDSNALGKKSIALKPKKYFDSNKHVLKVVTDSGNHALRMLYSVDSLQDSLQLPEITTAYAATLKKQNLNLPFTVRKLDSAGYSEDPELADITVGFAHPVTYHLSLGNTAPYLFKKISLPVLFSLFLAGVTLFSFVLLYRNLLRQHRLAEIKNDFISNISHELKTPIATVGVAIEALKNFNAMHDPQKTKEYLDISSNELQRLGLLVDKVLKLSMFEKKEIELNKENFNLEELTQEVMDSLRLQFEKNHAAVTLTAEGNDFIINADKIHITSVIYNLLDNALKYSSENAVINLALSKEKNIFELKVTDNGIGIEPEYQAKIFDRFFRVPTGNKHVVKGYGLGLSYVSEIIKRHMGYISVKSNPGKGSTFMVKLPAEEADIIQFDGRRIIRGA